MPVSAYTQVTELSPDAHACLTFGEREDLLDLRSVSPDDDRALVGAIRAAANPDPQ